jgi:hypothetical protein
MHILCVGPHAAPVCAALLEHTPPRELLKCESAVVPIGASLDAVLTTARQTCKSSSLNNACDALIFTWSAHAEIAPLFSLAVTLKPHQTRCFLAISDADLGAALARAETESPLERLLLQSALSFFQGRILTPSRAPVQAVKTLLLRSRPYGLPLNLEVLSSQDFIQGALLRRDACKALLCSITKDADQRQVITQRFRSHFSNHAQSSETQVPCV